MDLIEARVRLTEASLRGLEDVLEGLFANPVRIPGTGAMAECPIIGTPYIAVLDHSFFLPAIFRAMVEKEKFNRQYPTWPPLPLRESEIEALLNADDVRANLVGLFADSQRAADWDGHPDFNCYVRGLLAYEFTPDEIRRNPALWQQFPPAKLEGLCDGSLRWRSAEKIAWDRAYEIKCAEYHAAEAAGLVG